MFENCNYNIIIADVLNFYNIFEQIPIFQVVIGDRRTVSRSSGLSPAPPKQIIYLISIYY